jgi:hypothetical protein
MSRSFLQFAPQTIDIDLEHMAFPAIVRSPDVLQQEILGDDPPDILSQISQQSVFRGRQRQHDLLEMTWQAARGETLTFASAGG